MNNYKKLTYGGLIGALVFLGTWIIKIPNIMGYGYLNAGDGVILMSTIILGPYAAIPAAIGSSLADFAAGFPFYIPFTFVIKGLMAWLAATILKGKTPTVVKMIFAFIFSEVIMVGGYFLTEMYLYSLGGALASVPGNLTQAFFGIALGLFGSVMILRSKIKRF